MLWVGLLFSILGFAATLRQLMKMPMPQGDVVISAQKFRVRTAHCLVRGNYFQATAYALETLIIHLISNFMGLVDSNIDLWFLLGTIIRLAIRMGYHRDPSNNPGISPCDGEMRRRVWHTILQVDSLSSFQAGAPSMIPMDSCDTRLPQNLKDSDFSPETPSLPASRPTSDTTPVLYIIVKGGVMEVFKKIVSHSRSISPASYSTTIDLDRAARGSYNSIPEDFKIKPLSQSFVVTSNTIMNRVNIGMLYLTGLVILHRPYLNVDTSNHQYEFSRQACVDAALEILAVQADLHQALQPGGLMYEDRWMISSLTAHDFLLAAMVICLELSVRMRSGYVLPLASRQQDSERLTDVLVASKQVWEAKSRVSKEARTAAQLLGLMIQKVQAAKGDEHKARDVPHPSEAFTAPTAGIPLTLPQVDPMMDVLDGSGDLDWVSKSIFQ